MPPPSAHATPWIAGLPLEMPRSRCNPCAGSGAGAGGAACRTEQSSKPFERRRGFSLDDSRVTPSLGGRARLTAPISRCSERAPHERARREIGARARRGQDVVRVAPTVRARLYARDGVHFIQALSRHQAREGHAARRRMTGAHLDGASAVQQQAALGSPVPSPPHATTNSPTAARSTDRRMADDTIRARPPPARAREIVLRSAGGSRRRASALAILALWRPPILHGQLSLGPAEHPPAQRHDARETERAQLERGFPRAPAGAADGDDRALAAER
jgi:hypothetical protein